MFLLSTVAIAADATLTRLRDAALASDEPWAELVELCDDIGPRLSGSSNLDRAIRWAAAKMREDGLEVRTQPVQVRNWVRGAESGRILAPVAEPLEVLGLGGTVPTPEEGIEGRVLVVRDFQALEAAGERVAGKIVLFDPPWEGYGATVQYRTRGADRAAALGAKAVLVRSVTDTAMAIPHTGAVGYDGPRRIPAAAITVEAADRLRRWADRGRPITVRLNLQSEDRDPVTSHNVLGEVTGQKADEVVVVGCHLDSWDVGTGAQDDGAACVAAMEAVAQIRALGIQPRRTVRAVLFTNEENGLGGGRAYVDANPERHVALIESDTGMGGTLGFRVSGGLEDPEASDAEAKKWLEPVRALLAPVEQDLVEVGYAGADIGPMHRAHGGLALGVAHDMSAYWAIHHTEADTIDKIDPADLKQEVAMLAVVAWQLAQAETPIGPANR